MVKTGIHHVESRRLLLMLNLEASAYIRLEPEPGYCTETHYLQLLVTLCWLG